MKKLTAILLLVSMLAGMMAFLPVSAADKDNPTWQGTDEIPQGSGTKEDPYLVSSPAHLKWLSNLSQSGDQLLHGLGYNGSRWTPNYDAKTMELYEDYQKNSEKVTTLATLEAHSKTVNFSDFLAAPYIYIRQTCDIDLCGKSLPSICRYWVYGGVSNGDTALKGQFFRGHYDGQGYAIRNGSFSTNNNVNWSNGLFGVLYGATIENLVFDHITCSGYGYLGMVAGRTLTPAELNGQANLLEGVTNVIRNVHVKDTCTLKQLGASQSVAVGGILGSAYQTTIENCTNNATVYTTASVHCVGGILGEMAKDCTVNRCVNTGDIICNVSGTAGENGYGGIVGNWQISKEGGAQGNSAIMECLNQGSFSMGQTVVMSGASFSWGGILGRAVSLTAKNNSTYRFEQNINMGSAPDLTGVNVTDGIRSAACVGSVWHAAGGSWVKLNVIHCYTTPFESKMLAPYSVYPSKEVPIVGVYTSGDTATATNCQVLDKAALDALPWKQQIENFGKYNGQIRSILGAQTKKNPDGSYVLRLISGLDSLSYQSVRYTVRKTANGVSEESTYSGKQVFSSFLDSGRKVSTKDIGANYVALLEQTGLQPNVEYVFGVTATAQKTVNGKTYTVGGEPCILRFLNGRITFEETPASPTVRINGTNINNFRVVIPQSNNYVEFLVAQTLVQRIQYLTGNTLPISTATATPYAHEICIGFSRSGVADALVENEYAVVQAGGHLEMLFEGWNAANTLMDRIDSTYFPDGAHAINLKTVGDKLTVEESNPFWGKRTTSVIGSADLSTVQKESVGDIRIMFHNIWGYTNGHYGEDSVSLLSAIYENYQPDILGLEECKNLEGVVNNLKANGYSMVRFNRDNGYSNNNGHGNPIFYKTDRFTLVDSGYACYRNGDKGTTWAIFREKSSGKVFAVTNSHFCANSNAKVDGVDHDGFGSQRRNEDAQAMLNAVNSKILTNAEVRFIISGGDYNTSATKEVIYNGKAYHPYRTLINGGFTNIRDLVPDDKESLFSPMNGGAIFNDEWNRFNLKEFRKPNWTGAIDHIFYRFVQSNPIQVKHYTVLNDRLVCTASDHLPHMIDFVLK